MERDHPSIKHYWVLDICVYSGDIRSMLDKQNGSIVVQCCDKFPIDDIPASVVRYFRNTSCRHLPRDDVVVTVVILIPKGQTFLQLVTTNRNEQGQ